MSGTKPVRGRIGTVISTRMQKTITVRETVLVRHRRYGKYVRRATTYKVHDEKGDAQLGDEVEFVSTRPLSKTKRWRLLRVVRRGGGIVQPIAEIGLSLPDVADQTPKKEELPNPPNVAENSGEQK